MMPCCENEFDAGRRCVSRTPEKLPVKENVRFAVALLLACQSMMLGLAINLSPPDSETLRLLQTIVLIATLAVVGLLGWPLARSAWEAVRRRRVTLEALFVTGMLGATGASLQSFATSEGPIYFEVVSVLLVVYTLGSRVTAQSRAGALNAVHAWSQRLATCRVIDAAGHQRQAEVSSICAGDVVAVRPGELLTVDGEIVRGEGFMQEASISGEPFARLARPGDRVLAGSNSADADFQVRALSPGTKRQVDTLLAAVECACEQTTPAQARADRLAKLLFPLVISAALATFVVWTWRADWHVGLFNALSVLLVACPCALGLATPLALWSAMGQLAERGLVVTRGDFVERLASVDRVIFDKTGTLSEESASLIHIATVGKGTERTQLLSWIAAVERLCPHPIARAFASLSDQLHERSVRVVAIKNVAGCGVEATLENPLGKTHVLRLGRPEWFGRLDRAEVEALSRELPRASGIRIDVELDGQLTAIALVSDRLRASVTDALQRLRSMNLPIAVMTGDSKGREAAELVSEIHVGLLPADKLQAVEKLTRSGARPLFVGDGMNDAGALAVSHASLALNPRDDLAAASAQATLHHGDLRIIPWAIGVCRRTAMILRLNLLWAMIYNLLGISLAACGQLHPVAAALIMVISSLGVVWFSSHATTMEPACDCPPRPTKPATIYGPPRITFVALGHGLTLALQGVFLALLARSSFAYGAILVTLFGLAGWSIAVAWARATRIPHWIDMLVGMLTLGNFGMVAGWWIDASLGDTGGACPCQSLLLDFTLRSVMSNLGMLSGMLIAGSVAMAFWGRRPLQLDWQCHVSMFGGGNVGMLVGMLAGGHYAALIAGDQIMSQLLIAYAGMTVGMLFGMLAGHFLSLRLIQGFARVNRPLVQQLGERKQRPETVTNGSHMMKTRDIREQPTSDINLRNDQEMVAKMPLTALRESS
jgi:heavy metal translocating P-type ATPase